MGEAHAAGVTACAAGADGSFFVSASRDNTLKMWDPSSGEVIRTLAGHPNAVHYCAVGLDGLIYSAGPSSPTRGFSAVVKIWDPATGDEVGGWEQRDIGEITGLAVSPAGDFVAAVYGAAAYVDVRDPITGDPSSQIGTDDVFEGCRVSPDGRLVGASTLNAELVIFSPAEGRALRSFKLGSSRPLFAFTPDAAAVLFRAGGSQWMLAAVATGETRVVEAEAPSSAFAVSPDGSIFATSWQSKERAWSSVTGGSERATAPAVLRLRRIDSGALVHDLDPGEGEATLCAFSPDGTLLFAGAADSLKIFDVESGEEIGGIPLEAEPTCLAVHPSQPVVALGDAVGGFHVLDHGVEVGRIIVTAVDRGSGPEVRCAVCGTGFEAAVLLGEDVQCQSCDAHLRVNPFILSMRAVASRPLPKPRRQKEDAAPEAPSEPWERPEPATKITPINEQIKAMLLEEVAEAGVDLSQFQGDIAQMIVGAAMTQSVKGVIDSTDALLDAEQRERVSATVAAGRPHDAIATLHEFLPEHDVLGKFRAGLKAAYPEQVRPGNRAKMLLVMGKQDEALALFKEEEELSRSTGDEARLGEALGNQAVILRNKGDVAGAHALHEEEERLCRRVGDRAQLARSLGNRALIVRAQGRIDEALKMFEEKEAISREIGDEAGLALALGNIAEIAGNAGEIDRALALLEESAQLSRGVSNWEQLGASLAGRGVFLVQLGRAHEGLAALEEAHSVASEHGHAQLAGQIEPIRDALRQQLGASATPPAPAPGRKERAMPQPQGTPDEQLRAVLVEELQASDVLRQLPPEARNSAGAPALAIAMQLITNSVPKVLTPEQNAEFQRLVATQDGSRIWAFVVETLPPGDAIEVLRGILKMAIPEAVKLVRQTMAEMGSSGAASAAPPNQQKRRLFGRKRR